MLDERRILAKIDELDAYLVELRIVAPDRFEEYGQIEKKRSCEGASLARNKSLRV